MKILHQKNVISLAHVVCVIALAMACACSAADSSDPIDSTGSEDLPESDLVVQAPYPEGPYGVVMGETIDNLGFYEPEGETTEYLQQWYGHPEKKVLLIISTAAW